MVAAGAAHGVRALDAGQAQIVFALGALFVDVRLAILPAILSELEPLADACKEGQERAVLFLSLVDVSGQCTISRPCKQASLYNVDQNASQKEIQKHKPEAGPHHDLIELICAVSSAPKSPQSIPKSHVLLPFVVFLHAQRNGHIQHLAKAIHLHI